MRKIFFTILTSFLLSAGSNSFAQVFIAFDGVDGESTVKGLTNATEVQSFSWGATNSGTISAGAGGMSAGKVKMQDIVITKHRGAASATLQLAVFSGKHFPKAEIKFFRSGNEPSRTSPYLTITLEDVIISSWQLSGSGTEQPMESFSINFARMKFEEVVGTNPDGTVKKVTKGWDFARNSPY